MHLGQPGHHRGAVTLTSGGRTFEIEGKRFRPAFTVTAAGTPEHPTPQPGMDAARAELFATNMPPGSRNPTGVRFDIQAVPVPVPGKDAQVCCGPDAPLKLAQTRCWPERPRSTCPP